MAKNYIGKNITNTHFVKEYVVFDTETTGLKPGEAEIIEIAAIKVKDGQVVGKFSQFVKPNRPIPQFITELTGITYDDVKYANQIDVVLRDFLMFCDDAVLLGQNTAFDLRFIGYFSVELGYGVIENNFVDLVPISRKAVPNLPNHKLGTVANYLGLPSDGAHRALFDCEMTYICYEKLGRFVFNEAA